MRATLLSPHDRRACVNGKSTRKEADVSASRPRVVIRRPVEASKKTSAGGSGGGGEDDDEEEDDDEDDAAVGSG